MGIFICPRCQQRAIRDEHSGDFEHNCFGSEVLQNEDVPVIGAWTDYTGSDSTIQNLTVKGTENTLFGTRAWVEGHKEMTRTSRGYPTTTFRTRQHIHSIPNKFFDKQSNSETETDN